MISEILDAAITAALLPVGLVITCGLPYLVGALLDRGPFKGPRC